MSSKATETLPRDAPRITPRFKEPLLESAEDAPAASDCVVKVDVSRDDGSELAWLLIPVVGPGVFVDVEVENPLVLEESEAEVDVVDVGLVWSLVVIGTGGLMECVVCEVLLEVLEVLMGGTSFTEQEPWIILLSAL
jgi:hypothetical protein